MYQRTQWKRVFTVLGAASAMTMAITAPAWGSVDVPRSIEEAVESALEAWSEFAKTGNLSAVGASFASEGPQFRQLEVEASAGPSKPDGGAFEMTISDTRLRRQGSTTATVWTRIQISQAGHTSKVGSWDFDLIKEGGRWLVWTVVPAETPPEEAAMESGPPTTLATSTTTLPSAASIQDPATTRDPSPDTVMNAQPSSIGASTTGVRIPALSAWIVVVALVGVAVAGYLAPRVDRRNG